MTKRKGGREPDLSQWYKPTPEGSRARQHLMKDVDIGNQAGGVGKDIEEDAKKKQRKNKPKGK